MISLIKKSKYSKIVASYLAIQLLVTTIQPSQLFALTGGPSQPEFNSFTPIGTSDMVNLSSGDFNYNIPIMDVGGYPLNLAYNSGITMDQEASWVGLGWNLNVGQIARNVRGIPDDFKGDEIRYENDMRQNVTVGTSIGIRQGLFGEDSPFGYGLSLGVEYNNFSGISFKPSLGLSYEISNQTSLGLKLSASTTEGATVTPSVSLSNILTAKKDDFVNSASGNFGVSFNSRKGLENATFTATNKRTYLEKLEDGDKVESGEGTVGASISFNDQSYTPTKRAGLKNSSFSFNGGVGTTVFGADVQLRLNGYGSYQNIRNSEKDKTIPAFGYEHTEANEGLNGVLDFNREKERAYSENTTILPITNYTYDIYAIHGQGAGGQFRPFRSQTSYVYDSKISDHGAGGSFGLEADVGNLVHVGFDIKVSPSTSYTGKWEDKNFALAKFTEKESDNNAIDYEPVYFQTIGELGLDPEPEIFNEALYNNKAIKIGLGGSRYNRKALSEFRVKSANDGTNGSVNGTSKYDIESIDSKIIRSKRKSRNQSILKISNADAEHDKFVEKRNDDFAKSHHTVGVKVLKPDGSTYVFGKAAYNTKKVEATFDVSGIGKANIDCSTGIITGIGGSNIDGGDPRRASNKYNSDEFLNKITTPAYAHSYLLSSVLSSDYEDIDNNGPSLNDLGAYTLFSYKQSDNDYKWRVPYNTNEASYNEGLKSKNNDQKGNYLYGEKELLYIEKIETKTHVAIFKLKNREDGRGAKGETVEALTGPGYQRAIDKIYLLSRPEFEPYRNLFEGGVSDNNPVYDTLEDLAIKVAHFDYNYSLCPGVPNNLNGGGKLTLDKVYFTYRGSNMGKYTPYKFNYVKDFDGDGDIDNNEPYNLKGYDVWGNYKENDSSAGCEANDPITAAEFPYTDQNKSIANNNARQWTLTSIDLPSGGKLEVEAEADDYQYVQNKKVMQMFNVTGAGNSKTPSEVQLNTPQLYNGGNHSDYIYVKLSDTSLGLTTQDLLDKYIGNQIEEPIMFRMLLNMTNKGWQSDYVTGYFELSGSTPTDFEVINLPSGSYAVLPLRKLDKEGGLINSGVDVNPIAKAGWYYGRTYLNREVYSLGGKSSNSNFVSIVGDLVSSLGAVFEIFSGPNGRLQEKGCARIFNPEKSWVRLLNPTKRKLGGGLRVTKIQLHDNWDGMTGNLDNPLYKQFYGQEYNYNNEDGNTSGVATFEPASSKENPFVEPVYDKQSNSLRDRISAPKESNYTEKPIGESFFPSPTVTYGRVEVKNLKREKSVGNNETLTLKKHATGKVVNEFYTSFDFPTITDHTDVNPSYSDNASGLASIFNISVRNHFTLSQGFVVETNDMNGKMRSQRVYPEGQETPISGVDYNFSMKEDGTLENVLPTIDERGMVDTSKTLGFHYDVVNDFRENYSKSETFGVNTNFTAFLAGIFPGFVVFPVPQYAFHENILRTAVTTKVIHKTGILKEKVAYDLGAKVSTENLAWDAKTGDVLLTKTVNEYDKSYYNFTYPAYWYYKGMDQASSNLGIEGVLISAEEGELFDIATKNGLDITSNNPFYPGDMVQTYLPTALSENQHELLWVAKVEGNKIALMDKDGNIINHECSPFVKSGEIEFKIVRSGYRNQQSASMSSVTSLVNPIDVDNDAHLPSGEYNDITYQTFNTNQSVSSINPKVINASAVKYNDYWAPQDQLGLPRLLPAVAAEFDKALDEEESTQPEVNFDAYGFNPYLYNVRGEWRAVQSYAYLTNRTSEIIDNANPNLQDDGFFKRFLPYYLSYGTWEIQQEDDRWRTASTVTKYSPYGAELENKDALGRHSSATYGYGYTLPTAVASNNKYGEIAFDGFEDGDYSEPLNQTSAVVDEINYDTKEITYFNRDHFSFNKLSQDTQGNGEVSLEESHTGTKSYKLTGDKVQVTKGLTDYNHIIQEYPCYESDDQDAVIPITVDRILVTPLPQEAAGSQGTVVAGFYGDNNPVTWQYTITGQPNDIVYMHCKMHNQVSDINGESSTRITLNTNPQESTFNDANQFTISLEMVVSDILKIHLDDNGVASFTVESKVYHSGINPTNSSTFVPTFFARSTIRFFDALGRDKNSNVHGYVNSYSKSL